MWESIFYLNVPENPAMCLSTFENTDHYFPGFFNSLYHTPDFNCLRKKGIRKTCKCFRSGECNWRNGEKNLFASTVWTGSKSHKGSCFSSQLAESAYYQKNVHISNYFNVKTKNNIDT